MPRPSRHAPSFRHQIALSSGALVLGLATFLSVALGAMMWMQEEKAQGDALRAVAANVANALAQEIQATPNQAAHPGNWAWADQVVGLLAPSHAETLQVESFIFDRTGQMIYAQPGRLAKFVSAGQTLPANTPSSAQSIRWRDGLAYLTASCRIPSISGPTGKTGAIDLGWTVVTRQPMSIALAGAWAPFGSAVVLGSVSALLAVLLAWRLAGHLARPLTDLAASARLMADGQSTSVAAQDCPLEAQAVAGALNDMMAKLVEINAGLEARVRQRTEELVAANDALARLARLDPLTGLPNRRAFDERAAQLVAAARRSGKPLSVVTLDIDFFKRVNDIHGHPAGDTALVAIATAMRGRLREQDVVARIGGEEFAVLLPDTAGAGALIAANKIVEGMRALRIPVVGPITVSCGVADISMPLGDTTEALARADKALYRAKGEGRNRAVLNEDATALPATSALAPTLPAAPRSPSILSLVAQSAS
jgi:diguanylate cyclase (GGDEF)-like protein